jgi:hypothetical protein
MKLLHVIAIGSLSIFLVIGVALFALGLRNVWLGLASRGWPTVIGTVEASEVGAEATGDRRTGAESTMYAARIAIAYRVDGRDYTTETLQFGQTVGSGDSSEAELRRLRYAPGTSVTVAYDAHDPSLAVAEPGLHSDMLWLPGAGLGFFVPGLMFLLAYLATATELRVGGAAWLLFGAIFAAFGLVLLSLGLANLRRARASENWPVTRGTIVYGRIDASDAAVHVENGRVLRGTTEGAHLVYGYDVGGRRRYSNVRRFGQIAASTGNWASEIADRYPLGKEVTVAYDPADPDRAVLEPGIGPEAWWVPGAGSALLLFGMAVMFVSRRL